jgi:signal transduction histidine kinase
VTPATGPHDAGRPRWRRVLRWPFLPAIAVLDRLTFARKFILIGLLLSCPLAVVGWLQHSAAAERIAFNARERMGIAYLSEVRPFLHAVQLHRVLVAADRAGVADVGPARAQTVRQADAAAAAVARVDAAFGATLATTATWQAAERAWRTLGQGRAGPPDQQDAVHARVSAKVLALIVHQAGNYSNLILDPDLDSYWLMHALVLRLPELSETVSRATALALTHATAERPGDERAMALAADARLAWLAVTDLARVDLATAIRETPRFGRSRTLGPALAAPLAAVQSAVGHHAQEVQRSLDAVRRGAAVDRRALVETAAQALQHIGRLEAAIAPELDGLVQARLERHRAVRTQGLVAATAFAALLIYLFLAIYLSVRSAVAPLQSPPRPGESVLLVHPRDELGQMAQAWSLAQDEKSGLQEQLRLADRLATIGTLAAGTAHELNEPLGAILGFAQLAAKTPELPPATARDLAKIEAAALHAREIIRQLMVFSRQTAPTKAAVDLAWVVQGALELAEPRLQQAAVRVVSRLATTPAVHADAGQLRQVVLNLVVNAIQASARGSEIRVSLEPTEGAVRLTVEDDGAGMSEAVQKQVFLPFFTTKDVGQGTGLGLAVVHGIVTAHGGSVAVTSVPGHGSRFEVLIPQG